jgi:hypothetical protein
MVLTPQQAAETLGEISRAEQRSALAHCYANASPGFILWGFIWVAGYTGTYLLPNYGFVGFINWLWFGLTAIGAVGSALIGRHQSRNLNAEQQAAARAVGRRIGMSAFAAWLFVVAAVIVMRPFHPLAVGAFIPLLVSLAYALFGIWRGPRFLYAGIVVAVLTLGGWFYLRELFALWMAFVGGGSLVLVGLWLKKV